MHPCVHSLAVAKGKRVKALLLNRHPANAQSKGAVLWEKGTHSASTLDFILSSAQRTTHVPAFLRKQIAPYLADNGVPAEPAGSVDSGVELDESSGQRVAASRPPAPSGSVVSDAGGARNALSAGHALDEDQATAADSMLEQPAVSDHELECVAASLGAEPAGRQPHWCDVCFSSELWPAQGLAAGVCCRLVVATDTLARSPHALFWSARTGPLLLGFRVLKLGISHARVLSAGAGARRSPKRMRPKWTSF